MSLSTPPRLLATMAAHLPVPRLPVLLFVLLAVHVPSTHGDPLPSTYDGSMCSERFMCGGVNIHYPFYLSNATRETTEFGYSYFCGYTDLKISCQLEGPTETETPVITLGGENYTVQNIFYDNHTIILADSDVLAGGSCPAVGHNVSFDELWLHNSSTFLNLTFFFGCYPYGTVPLEFDAYKINCPVSPPGAGPGHSFVLTPVELDSVTHPEQELVTKCSKVVTVPVIGDFLRAASNLNSFTSGGYGDVLKSGFELEWSRLTADQCQQCEESYGRCAYSQKREFMGCLCHGGKVGDPDCEHIVRASSKSFTRPFVSDRLRP